jgi:hypothetical protein
VEIHQASESDVLSMKRDFTETDNHPSKKDSISEVAVDSMDRNDSLPPDIMEAQF